MAQQLFNFPGYFDREIDLTARSSGPVGVPAGVVGASVKGPAFVPYTIGSFSDFVTKFGGYDPKLPAPYAVDKFLQNRNALTFIRILGAGSNTSQTDIDTTRTAGTVRNAGFKVSGSNMGVVAASGSVAVSASIDFQDNDIVALTASNGVIAELTFVTSSTPVGLVGSPSLLGGKLVQTIGVAVTSSTDAQVTGYITGAVDLLRTVGASGVTLPIFASIVGTVTASFVQQIAGPDGNTPIDSIFGSPSAPIAPIVNFSGGQLRKAGAAHFLVARHSLQSNESYGFPMFTGNDSYPDASNGVNLVRGVIFVASGSRVMVMSASNETFSPTLDDVAIYSTPSTSDEPYFKIVISTSLGSTFGSSDGLSGIRILSASFNPTSDLYFGKLLNTDPNKFEEYQHYLYSDFAVDDEVATVIQNTVTGVLIASGTDNTSATSGLPSTPFIELFGRYDTRFTTPRTTAFISQPYGSTEYDLFHIEAIDDGVYANDKIKISIQNIQASTNPRNGYGSFTLTVRRFDDNDYNQEVIEQFNDLSLDPENDKYIARVIGDAKAYYNFDVEDPNDRRIIRSGKYGNQSNYIRVVMNEMVEQKMVPATALPFGFRGPQLLNTNPNFTDISSSVPTDLRLAGDGASATFGCPGAIVPPVPYRFKVTRGAVTGSGDITALGPLEITDGRLYWGVKFERTNNNILNSNIGTEQNRIIRSFSQFAGIGKLDVLVTGSSTDQFNNNKFTLARVALGTTSVSYLTSSAQTQMKNALYVRDGVVDPTTYTVTGSCLAVPQITFATLIHSGTQPIDFNRFNNYAKFTTFLYGGFDGVNILDQHARRFDDRSTSTEFGVGGYGGAHQSYDSPGFDFNQNGFGIFNNQINSYRVATDIITDSIASNINLLAIPGQREPFVTSYASDAAADYGLALYLMDIPSYNSTGTRIFDSSTTGTASYINVQNTADEFDTRAIDNTFVAAYFPDIVMNDPASGKKVTVPSSVAALAAIGFNDKVAYPWFAPAGFNRASLNFVSLTRTRVNQSEREKLYATRVNPVVKFPNEGYVIFAQKTLNANQTALDSINVQRMVMDVQRQVIDIGNRLIWQQLTPELYQEFVARVTPVLALVQSRGGLRQFKVVCDETINSEIDRENNKMNAKIYLLPVKAVEFIAIDFIITRAGVQFG